MIEIEQNKEDLITATLKQLISKMKILIQLFAILAIAFSFEACQNGGSMDAKAESATLTTVEDSMMYGIGMYNMDILIKQFKIEEPDMTILYKGMKDYQNESTAFSVEDFNTIAQSYFQEQAVKAAEENVSKGATFLEGNSMKDGVITTESGLQYKIIEEGNGQSPSATDMVTVHYAGRLMNGDEFDSSTGGEPATFGVNQVIPGWTEALQMMKPGAKWELYIPGELAYGPRGSGDGSIGPNEVLIFDVELISVDAAPQQ